MPLTQGSKEWKDWRYGGVTATDMAVLMGSSKYKTVHQLWKEKVSCIDSTVSNYYMQEGTRLEPIAKAWIEADKGIVLDSPCITHDLMDIARCSLDGLDLTNGMLYEIKCPHSKDKVLKAKETASVELQWIHQVQWQLFVSGLEKGYIVVWDQELLVGHYIPVDADKEMHKTMASLATDFWFSVITLEEPPLKQDEVLQIHDEDIAALLKMYSDVSDKIVALEKQQKSLKDLICKEKISFKCQNYLVKEWTATAYDFKKMQEDGIQLDDYKKPGTKYFRITKTSDSKKTAN